MTPDPFVTIGAAKRLAAATRRWALGGRRRLTPARIRPDRPGPPNLLVVAIDTLRWDHLGLAGRRPAVSPAIDRLAAGGTCFTDVTAPAPWTLSSFTSSLTGAMPSLHGAGLAGNARNLDQQPPRRFGGGLPTLASHLADQGYRTAAFYANPFVGFGLAETFAERRYYNLPAHELAFLALDWVRRHGDEPFFCFVLCNDPHEPTAPPARFLDPLLAGMGAAPPPGSRSFPRRWRRALARWGDPDRGVPHLGHLAPPLDPAARAALALKLALYDAAIANADAAVATVATQLAAWGLDRSTVLAVYSDHGEEFLDHLDVSRLWNHDPRGLHGIGHGHSLFQEVLRVPWVAAGPGVPAGARVTAPASLCDVAPTLCDWLGVAPLSPPAAAPGLAGRSLAKAALAEARRTGDGAARAVAGVLDTPQESERTVLAEDLAYGPDLVAARQGAWKLIAHRDGRPLALFDLAADPGETRDLRDARPDIAAALATAAAPLRAVAPAADAVRPPPGGWDDISDRVRRQLKELGYSE